MANTTNYNWETPDDTDLVKDGAAAIRTLGSSIDTTTKNLNPQTTTGALAYRSATANVNTALPIGTAGQVLRVNSGATAPEWATTADQTPLTTKGDLFGFDTADARIPIGTNGHILTADSTQALGLKWAAPAGGASGMTFISRTTFSNVANKDIDVFDNTYETYLMIIENIHAVTSTDDIFIQGRYGSTVYTSGDYYAANAYIKFDTTAWTWINTNAQASLLCIPQTNSGYPAQAAIYFNNVGDASKYLSMYGQWSTREGMLGGQIYGEIFSQQTWGGIRLLTGASNITGEVSFYGLAKA